MRIRDSRAQILLAQEKTTETTHVDSHRIGETYSIVWCSTIGPPEFESLATKYSNLKVIHALRASEAIRHLTQMISAVLVIDDQFPEISEMETIIRETQAGLSGRIRILIVEDGSFNRLQDLINTGHFFRIVLASERGAIESVLFDCVDEFFREHNRLELVKRSSRQNRELEDLTRSLESRVAERTKGIVVAKEQEEEKLRRMRRLVRFIKELTAVANAEELLEKIRWDLRPFHQVVTPSLVFPVSAVESAQVFFDKSQVFTRSIARVLENSEEARNGILAKQLGRPVGKIMSFALNVMPRTAYLLVEHTATFKEGRLIENHLSEVLRPIEMTLERILLEFENNFLSFRWEKTFDGLNEPISIIDAEMRLLRSNDKFAVSARSGQAFCHQVFDQREALCEGCPVPEVVRRGKARTGMIQRAGRTVKVQSFPISLVEGGTVTNIVNFYEDITDQRELQRRVLQSEKMSAIGLLAGNIAHELNNPLTGLRSLAQVLQAQVQSGSQQESDLHEIEKAAVRCQAIIRNLLDFTKPGQQGLVLTTFDEIVERTMPFLKSMLRNHRVVLDLQAKANAIEVEPNLLQQVVFNLVNNACQAMGKAGTLTLSSRLLHEQDIVCLEIQDTGVGIAKKDFEKIFQPFFTTKSEGHGTGLGLNLSREIVEKFGGQITFESKEGEGTIFRICLPSKNSSESENRI